MAILRALMSIGAPGSAYAARAARLRPALAGRLLRTWLGWGAQIAIWAWLPDAVRVSRELHAPPPVLAQGLFAALFRGFAIALPLGFALALALWLAALRRHSLMRPALSARLGAFLREGSAAEQLARAGDLLGAALLLPLWAASAVRVCERLIVGMARPQFAAMACVASCACLLLMAAVLFPACAALGALVCRTFAAIPRFGPRLFGGTLHWAVWLGTAAVAALGLVLYRFRTPLAYLPWPQILQLTAAVALASLGSWLGGRLPRRARASLRAAGAVLVLAAIGCAVWQSPLAVLSRQVSERESLAGRLGQAALLAGWDRDLDGYLPGLGGGDCAPRDRARNPGANEVPQNGVDEDCDGVDLELGASALRGKYDYPVPGSVPARPPIVLITVDAFAARHMRALGYARDITPNIDAFAARSAFFRECYAQGPSTRLSFPSLFTSRWDTQIEQELVGHHPFPVGRSERLLAEVLRDAGYETAAVLSDPYFSPRYWRGIARGFNRVDETAFTTEPRLPHNGSRVTQAALSALQSAGDKPLFLWVHYYDAHSPHDQPDDMPRFGRTRQDIYDAELKLVDREVGQLLTAIDARWGGQALVVLTGDHGIAFDEPRHATFNYGYDLHSSVLHVPLIFHAGFLPARSVDGVVSTMDIAPTLANLLRLRGPLPYEGVSLVPELLTGTRSRPPELMHQFFIEERKWKNEEPLERVSLRTERWNLLQDRKTGFFELYDYRRDYFETQDLAHDPLYGATLAALRKQLTILLYSAQPAQPEKAAR